MTHCNRRFAIPLGVAALLLAPSQLHAAAIFWQGGNGNLTDPNYSDGTNNNLAPTAADVVNFGNGGTATHSVAGVTTFSKLRVGHNESTPGGTGAGDVTVNNGAQIALTGGAGGNANAGMWVGNAHTSTLTIDGVGSSVTSNRLVVIGYAPNQPSRSGTVRITNGGALLVTQGNINIGDSPSAGQNGMQGHLFVDGIVTQADASADLVIGAKNATSSFTQTGGTVTIGDVIQVGAGGTSNSSFNLSGGTTTHGGSFFVGVGSSTGATANISGGTLNTGLRFLTGGGTATGMTVNHSGGTVNTTLDVRVGDVGPGTSIYNLSGTGVINATTGGWIGRQGTATFNQTGGEANFNANLRIGQNEGGGTVPTALYAISGGELNVLTDLAVAADGTGELRVLGDEGLIDVNGNATFGNTANGLATLAFELQAGELLSLIDVAGTATFSAGSKLVFDTTAAAPTQTVYDLLTAASIDDQGIAFTGPAGWSYQIVPGGNGQVLQAVIPEPGAISLAAVASAVAAVRRRRR